MSLFNESDENNREHPETEAAQPPESTPEPRIAQPPANEYWAKHPGVTPPAGYGQGYRQQPYQPYPPNNASHGYPPYPQHPDYGNPHPFNPSGSWQQPAQENYQWNFQDYDQAAQNKPGDAAKKKKSRGLVVFMVSILCVLALVPVGIAVSGVVSYLGTGSENVAGEALPEDPDASSSTAQLEIASRPQISEAMPIGEKMTTPQVAKAVSPSVVGVVQYQPNMTISETGEGSGIIMTADGYIITNAHVVYGGTDFKVILHDGTPKDADLIGADSLTDIAVLKVNDITDLSPAIFGDSQQIEVGEQVVAIGNPGGKTLAGSVTQGIVSAVNREIPDAGNLPINIPLIQTDAAINPGNSGGALVNEYGQVIGINSSKIVAPGFEGIGFAIPISEAKPIIDDIVSNGRVTGRVKLGITARQIDEIDARNTGLQVGIRIEAIDPESDLNGKGIQKFDIITHINGERIYTTKDLKSMLDQFTPGDRVTLTLYRPLGVSADSNMYQAEVTLMEDIG